MKIIEKMKIEKQLVIHQSKKDKEKDKSKFSKDEIDEKLV